MRGDEAKNVCPGINLVQVPVSRDKADLNVYRSAGTEVRLSLQQLRVPISYHLLRQFNGMDSSEF